MKNSAYIGNITVTATQPYIVYGSVRGLVSEHRTHEAAEKRARKDARDCGKVGGYSDANVYTWDAAQGVWV